MYNEGSIANQIYLEHREERREREARVEEFAHLLRHEILSVETVDALGLEYVWSDEVAQPIGHFIGKIAARENWIIYPIVAEPVHLVGTSEDGKKIILRVDTQNPEQKRLAFRYTDKSGERHIRQFTTRREFLYALDDALKQW